MPDIQPNSPINHFLLIPLVSPERAASDAILHGDMTELQDLVDTRQVSAETRTEGGITLLMWAVRHNNLDAFDALCAASNVSPTLRVSLTDDAGNNLVHYIVQHLDDDIFNPPPVGTNWGPCVQCFIEEHRNAIEWAQTNGEGFTVEDLARELDKPQMQRLLGFWSTPGASLSDPYASDSSEGDADSSSSFSEARSIDRDLEDPSPSDTERGSNHLQGARMHSDLARFEALLADFEPQDLNQVDPEGNTILHSFARYMPDDVFAEPSSDRAWKNRMTKFLESHRKNYKWEMVNREGLTALELAENLDKINLEDFLANFLPEPSPDIESSRHSRSISSSMHEPVPLEERRTQRALGQPNDPFLTRKRERSPST